MNGQLKSEGLYKDGKGEGLVKEYYENGQLKREGVYKSGMEEGAFKDYYENGKLKSETEYKRGVKSGPFKVYDEAGQLKNEGVHKAKEGFKRFGKIWDVEARPSGQSRDRGAVAGRNECFPVGESKDYLTKVMGPPASIENIQGEDWFFYGSSYVQVDANGRIKHSYNAGELKCQ
jgi:hypothetical protein